MDRWAAGSSRSSVVALACEPRASGAREGAENRNSRIRDSVPRYMAQTCVRASVRGFPTNEACIEAGWTAARAIIVALPVERERERGGDVQGADCRHGLARVVHPQTTERHSRSECRIDERQQGMDGGRKMMEEQTIHEHLCTRGKGRQKDAPRRSNVCTPSGIVLRAASVASHRSLGHIDVSISDTLYRAENAVRTHEEPVSRITLNATGGVPTAIDPK